MRLGRYVNEQRRQKRISLRAFCKATDIDPSFWSKVERGVARSPLSWLSSGHVDRIAKAVGAESWLCADLLKLDFTIKTLGHLWEDLE